MADHFEFGFRPGEKKRRPPLPDGGECTRLRDPAPPSAGIQGPGKAGRERGGGAPRRVRERAHPQSRGILQFLCPLNILFNTEHPNLKWKE